jgi:Na+/H+ antiporter NhaC
MSDSCEVSRIGRSLRQMSSVEHIKRAENKGLKVIDWRIFVFHAFFMCTILSFKGVAFAS